MTVNEAVCSAVISRILTHEGGISQNIGESFVTRFGQTPEWLAFYSLPVPATKEQAAANYRVWLTLTKLEAVCSVDDGLPDAVIDWAVLSGEGPAIRALQAAIGTRPDGVIGPETLAKLDAATNRRGMAVRIVADNVDQIASIVSRDPSKLVFLTGWMARASSKLRSLAA